MRIEAELHPRRPDRIALVTPYTAKDLVRTVPGARWSKDDSAWSVPLAWTSCLAMRDIFKESLVVGDALTKWAWARKRDVIDPAMALRETLEYSDGDPRLYPFQRAGVAFLTLVKRALLADEMGSGKTVQCTIALKELYDKGELDGPILIVCPNTMKLTWERELRTWWTGRDLHIEVISGTAAQRRKKLRAGADVAIINWEALRSHSRLTAYGSTALRRCVECGGSGTVKQAQCEVHVRELNEIEFAAVVADECFTAGVKIQTPSGERNIEDLRPGDVVWGYDHDTNSVVESKVAATMHRESGCVLPGWNVTPNHPFYVVDEGYRAAGDLTDEDVLYGFVHQDLPGVRPTVQRVGAKHTATQVLLDEVQWSCERAAVAQEHALATNDAAQAQVRVVQKDVPASVQEDEVPILHQVMRQQSHSTSPWRTGTSTGQHEEDACDRRRVDRDLLGQRTESVQVHDRGTAVCNREALLGRSSQWRVETEMALTRAGAAGFAVAGRGDGVDARVRGQAEAQSRVPRSSVPSSTASDRSGRWSTPLAGPQGVRHESHATAGDRRMARHPLLELRSDQRYLSMCEQGARPDGDTVTVYSLTTETGNYFANDVLVRNCHRAKDPQSMQTRALWSASGDAKIRFGMTGTPIANDPTELWPILHWLDSVEWPSKTSWVTRLVDFTYNIWGGMEVNGIKPGYEGEFHATIDPHLRRMTKEIVLPFLPPLVPERRDVEMNATQKKAYDQMRDLMIARLDAGVLLAANPMVQTGRLMQLASSYGQIRIVKVPMRAKVTGPVPFDTETEKYPYWNAKRSIDPDTGVPMVEFGDKLIDAYTGEPLMRDEEHLFLVDPSAKLDAFMYDLDDFLGHSIIVFAESRQLIEMLSARLLKKGIQHGLITGAIDEATRNRNIEDFQAGKFQLMLCTIKAGGVGITLTKASVEVFLQRSWSPVDMDQAIARAHRIGSEEHEVILVVDYVTPGTVEEIQLLALDSKRELLEEIVHDEELMRKFLMGELF